MQSQLLQKSYMDFLFLNWKEVVPSSWQFHYLVLWLCRKCIYACMHVSMNTRSNPHIILRISYCFIDKNIAKCCSHNLFLHSALVLSRKVPRSVKGIKVKSFYLADYFLLSVRCTWFVGKSTWWITYLNIMLKPHQWTSFNLTLWCI